jgi:hypothetical protein
MRRPRSAGPMGNHASEWKANDAFMHDIGIPLLELQGMRESVDLERSSLL